MGGASLSGVGLLKLTKGGADLRGISRFMASVSDGDWTTSSPSGTYTTYIHKENNISNRDRYWDRMKCPNYQVVYFQDTDLVT